MMKTGQNLSNIQIQHLTLTPEIRQSLHILQTPVLDLETLVAELLTENCVLELNDEPADFQEKDDFSQQPVFGESLSSFPMNQMNDEVEADQAYNPREGSSVKDQDPFIEPSWDDSVSLSDYLTFQLHLANLSPTRVEIGEFLIGNIDEDGYLQCNPEEVLNCLQASPEELTDVLQMVQTFDPPGVGSRSLSECLKIQLDAGKENWIAHHGPEAWKLADWIIKEHLDAFVHGNWHPIAAKSKVTLQTLQRAADLIRKLDPKPGRRFGLPQQPAYLYPDAVIKKADGEYAVAVDDPVTPRLHINPFYQQILASETGDPETLQYIKKKIQAALWVVKSLEQRKSTLYKIAESIMAREKDFLDKGPICLQPLTLREIAAATGLHESTVSRAAQGKYLETPQGIYPFKYFFDSKIDSAKGSPVAAKSVKKLIEQAVYREDKKNPLSDQQLSDLLKKSGVNVSRRTVAKYREKLAIPPSLQRRRF